MHCSPSAALEGGENHEHIHKLIQLAEARSADQTSIKLLKLRRVATGVEDTSLASALAAIEPRKSEPRSGAHLLWHSWNVCMRTNRRAPGLARVAAPARTIVCSPGAIAEVSPGFQEAAWAFALLAAQLKRDLDVAAERLVEARALPRNPDLAVAAALLAEARGEPGSIAPNLVEVLRFSHRQAQRTWAAQRLDDSSGKTRDFEEILICALLGLGHVIGVHAGEPRVGKYVKYDAGEFVIITSRSASQARASSRTLPSSGSRSNACWACAPQRAIFRPPS